MKITDKILGIEAKVESKFKQLLNSTVMKSFAESIGARKDETKYSKSPDRTGRSYANLYAEEIYIYGCVYLISNTIAKLQLKIWQDVKNKEGHVEKKDITATHPANALFIKPNFQDSFYDLKEQASANLELTGTTYLLMDKQNSKGQPESIYCLNSRAVEIIGVDNPTKIETLKDMIQYFKYGNNVKYEVEQILMEKKFSTESALYGQSPVMVAGQVVDTTREARNRNIAIFSNGMSGDSAFETEQQYNDVLYKRLKQDIGEKYQGAKNYHQPYVLFGGLKLKTIGISQKDLDFIQGMKLSREEICGFLYQVPPILLGVLENSSYNNIKEATKIFYNFSIKPRLVKIEELLQKLVDLYDVKGAYVEFDLSDVEELRENISDKIVSAQQLFAIGIPLNQIITSLNLPFKPVTGGDVGYLPFSLQPMGNTRPEASGTPIPPAPAPKKVKAFTEQMIEAKQKRFEATAIKNELAYKKSLSEYFKDQHQRLAGKVKSFKSISKTKIGDNAFAIIGETLIEENLHTGGEVLKPLTKKESINIDSVLFDEGAEVKRLQKVAIPHYQQAMIETGNAELELLGASMSFDVSNPAVIEFLREYSLEKCSTVLTTEKDALRELLIESVNEGDSIPTIMEKIDDFYSKYEDLSSGRLEVIARTEIVGASNQGALFSYKDAGVELKGWSSALDDRVRDTHLQAFIDYKEGIPLDEDFEVGTDVMSAPCQGLVAEENCNCRCSIIPIIGKTNE